MAAFIRSVANEEKEQRAYLDSIHTKGYVTNSLTDAARVAGAKMPSKVPGNWSWGSSDESSDDEGGVHIEGWQDGGSNTDERECGVVKYLKPVRSNAVSLVYFVRRALAKDPDSIYRETFMSSTLQRAELTQKLREAAPPSRRRIARFVIWRTLPGCRSSKYVC